MKRYKCRCTIVTKKQREKLKYAGQFNSGDYYCFGCDNYFAPFTIFNYIMYYLGKLFKKNHMAFTNAPTWIDVKWKLINTKLKLYNYIRKNI